MNATMPAGEAGGTKLKVLLVDDEYMVLDTLKSDVRWSALGLEVVATAINGRQALEKCALHKPELIVTDLTMPVMDGLELIATLRRDFPDVRFAVLTAHKEFDFAKRAVDLNAMGYLLKTPTNIEDIERTLQACAETIRSERILHNRARYAEQMMAQHIWEIRRRALGDLLRGTHIGERQLGQLFPWIERAGARPVMLGIYATLRRRNEFYARYPESDHPLLDYTMLQAAYEIVQELAEGTVLPHRPGEALLVLPRPAHESGAQLEAIVQQLQQRLSHWMRSYFGVDVLFGICSSASFDIAALRRTVQDAVLAADAAFYEPGPIHRLIDFQTKVWDRAGSHEWAVMESRVLPAWSSQDVEERLEGLRQFMAFVKANRPRPAKLKQKAAAWLEQTGSVPLNRNDWIALEDNSDMTSWFGSLEALLVRLPRSAVAVHEGLHPDIHKAVEFIYEHLEEKLTLTRVAEHIHMNPSYLSHLFKEETGENFLDFVTLQRIGKAKEFLASSKYKNYELAEKTGFVSYPHFCTVFKKVTGQTPSEYKKSLHEG